MNNEWKNWRLGTLILYDTAKWQSVYDFMAALITDMADHTVNYNDKIPLDKIDYRVMLFVYNLFRSGKCTGDILQIGINDYRVIQKKACSGDAKKLMVENGLQCFGFTFDKNEQTVRVSYPAGKSLFSLLHELIGKCSQNKGYGFYSFLRRNLAELDKKQTVSLNFCISRLPREIQNEIIATDQYILSLGYIKLKRKFEYDCEKFAFWAGWSIKYVSDAGFCYSIKYGDISHVEKGEIMGHNAWWTIMPAYKGIRWCRKNDFTVEALEKLHETNPDTAAELFGKLKICNSCHSERCIGRTHYQFNNKKIIACHGRMYFETNAHGFGLACRLIQAIDCLLGSKACSTDGARRQSIASHAS